MLLAVAQSRSLHVMHEAYVCKSCFRNAIYQHFNNLVGNTFRPDEEGEVEAAEKRASEKEPCRLLINW